MTALMISPLEQRILRTVREEVEATPAQDWHPRVLQVCLDLVQVLRKSVAETQQSLEKTLAEGVEAREFVQRGSPLLRDVDKWIGVVQDLIQRLKDTGAPESLIAELRLLEQADQTVRNLLAEAVSLASKPPRPIDWDRVRASEAAYARGETKVLS